MTIGLRCFLAVLLSVSVAWAQGTPNVPLLAHVNSYPAVGYNDCWGYTAPDGREYALLGVQNGTSILDITDTDNVVEVKFIPSATSLWKDIKTYQHYAYVVTEATGGMQIIDLSDLPNDATLVNAVIEFSSSHNIYIDEASAICYVEGSFSEPVRVYSLADPVNPVKLSGFGIECHDIFARDNIAYISEGGSGSIGIYDLTNPSQPQLLQRLNIPSAGYVHNCWLTDDNNYLMTTEETTGKTIKMWDISDLNNITLTDQVLAPGGLAHNAHIKGDFAYVSHYSDGLRIYDISDPTDIFEAGYYDTSDDWGTFPYFKSGKVLISDIDDGLYVVFFEGAREGDPLDPLPPSAVSAYSDYSTPTAIRLTWSDPQTLFNGDTLLAADFTIEVYQDGSSIANVAGGIESYEVNGLTDGQLYEFELFAKLVANDSLSSGVKASWHAGGSPVPAAPESLSCNNTGGEALLTWNDPLTQSDGTPLDDLAGINIYRDGNLIGSVPPGEESFTDEPSPGFSYEYTLRAIDNETPPNESKSSNSVVCYVGDAPDYLVWVGPDVAGQSVESGDSIFAALADIGASVFLTNDLFEFGSDLSSFKAVFVVLGIFGDNHVLGNSDPEAQALDAYLSGGGKLYLEGGDCFNYDPTQGGYDIRPWFGLAPGSDGSGDVFSISGQNALFDFSFDYAGPNNWMDELVPTTAAPLWLNPDNGDVLGVYNDTYGNGLAIGVVPLFGGLVETSLAVRVNDNAGQVNTEKNRAAHRSAPRPFVKKYAHFPDRAVNFSDRFPAQQSGGQLQISAGSKTELMAAYLLLLSAPVVGIDDPIAVPEGFALSQNYPNPFNPSTTIQLTLPEKARVQLTVFNALGQEVAEIHNGELAPGEHRFTFESRDLASGVYFYRAVAGSFTQTRKMLLLR